MPLRCPVCKVENSERPTCRRCKADLSVLFDLEECRDYAMEVARSQLRQGEASTAIGAAELAHGLRSAPDSENLLAVIHLLERDFAKAWMLWKNGNKNSNQAVHHRE